MVIPIVIGALGTFSKDLAKRLGEREITRRNETIQTTGRLKPTRILRRVLET